MENKLQNKVVSDFPDYIIYENGDVFSILKGKLLTPFFNKDYLTVRLYKSNKEFKNAPVHKIVVEHFGDTTNATNWIKHIDNNKQNNHYTNLVYCKFKELLNVNKTRNKSVYSFPTLNKVEAYKYYFQSVPQRKVKALITTLRYFADSIVIKKRWRDKNKFNESERIFKRYCEGCSYKKLAIEFNLSGYRIKKAILEIRSELIKAILSDVKNGVLIYSPIEPIKEYKMNKNASLKVALMYWEKYKKEILINQQQKPKRKKS